MKILINSKREKLLVVPSEYRQKIMGKCHTDTLSGHLGIAGTKQKISQNYYWPKMGKEIKEFCQSCNICQMKKNREEKSNTDDCNTMFP